MSGKKVSKSNSPRVLMHMPKECVCERKGLHAYCSRCWQLSKKEWSYRKESAYAVSKEKDTWKLKSKPPHNEKENEEQIEIGRAHQSLQDRQAIEKPGAVTLHSEESQRRKAGTCNLQATPCLSFCELSMEHHLLAADDRVFRGWCSDGQETRSTSLSATLNRQLEKAFRKT